ncbi:MAG: bifunctional glycosyltransferase family 2/GtrA family protein [Candidatus Omnitrophica bacterium]|nr:bifunctional glycosyltransferase family 2/GtrA family protein [Candidatus Omnitrophota bacterium]
MNKPELSIILPCYNESRNLPLIVERMKQFWPQYRFELVLVNNGSTDDTAAVLERLKNKYPDFLFPVTIELNLGYGHGIHTGLKASRADVVAYTHADIQTPPEDVFRAYQMYKKHPAPGADKNILVKGLRLNRREEEQFLTRWFSKIVRLVLGYPLDDINGQPKLFSRVLLSELRNPPRDFSYDLYVMYMARLRQFALVVFSVDFGERAHGKSHWATSVSRKYQTILKYLANIFKMGWEHRSDGRNLFGQVLRFLATGVVTNVVNYGLFWTLLRLLNVDYRVSSACGFFAGFVAGFFINRAWTFKAAGGRSAAQWIKFSILNAVSFGANLTTIWIFTAGLHWRPEFSQIMAIGGSMVINFVGSKLWVFRRYSA